MTNNPKIPLLVSLPEVYFDRLRRMVAERLLKNPRVQVYSATIAQEIIGEYLDHLLEGQGRTANDKYSEDNTGSEAGDRDKESTIANGK